MDFVVNRGTFPRGTMTRECSKCGDDLRDRYGKYRYCHKCHAEYMRDHRKKEKQKLSELKMLLKKELSK